MQCVIFNEQLKDAPGRYPSTCPAVSHLHTEEIPTLLTSNISSLLLCPWAWACLRFTESTLIKPLLDHFHLNSSCFPLAALGIHPRNFNIKEAKATPFTPVSLWVPQCWLNRSGLRTLAHQWIITHRIVTLDFTTTSGFKLWSIRSLAFFILKFLLVVLTTIPGPLKEIST